MSKFREPTLEEIKNPGSLRPNSPIRAAATQWREPVITPPPKKEIPFEGGHELEIPHPLGSTKLNLSGPEVRFFAGAGARMNDVKDRVQQILDMEGTQKRIDERRIMDAPLLETTAGSLGHIAPDVAALAFANGPRAMSTLGSMGIGAAQGASQPLTSFERANNAGLVNAGVGAFGGGLGKVVGDTLANTVGKAVHGLRPNPVWKDPEQRRLYELAQKNGIKTTIGDIDPFSAWHSAENLLENLPSGRKQFLLKQQDQMQRNIHSLRQRHGADQGDDVGQRIATGLEKEHAVRKGIASDLFNEVDEIAANTPNLAKVKPDNTHTAAKQILDEYPDLFTEFQNNPFMRKVLGIERDTGPQSGLIVNPRTNQPFKYDQELEFKDAQYLRKRLGAWYADLNKKFERGTLNNAGNDAVAKSAQLLKAVDDDLEAWANQGGAPLDLKEKWDFARQFFKNEVMPYRDPAMLASKNPVVRNIVNDKADTAAIPDKVLPTRETSVSSDVMDLSTEEGREAMRAALIAKLTDESVQHQPRGFDTSSIVRNTEDFANTSKAVLTPTQTREVADLSDLSGLTSRANNILRGDASYGERLPAYLMGGSAMLGLPSLAYMGASAFGPEDLTAGEKFGLALTLGPLAALAGSRAANKYTGSRFGKNFHFVDPKLEGVQEYLQRFGAAGVRGTGAPVANEFERHSLGWRNAPGNEEQ